VGIDCDKVVFTLTGSDQTYKRLNNIGNKDVSGIHNTQKKLIEINLLPLAERLFLVWRIASIEGGEKTRMSNNSTEFDEC